MAYDFPVKPHASVKELVRCSLITAVVWWWSLSILFPFFLALTLSKFLRNIFFVFIYNHILTKICPEVGALRKMFFEILYKEIDSEQPLKVLEVGTGSGANFEYYSKNHRLTLLDSNPGFDKHIKEQVKKYPKIVVEDILISKVENMSIVPDEEYDVVVCTHLFCSVSDVNAALSEIQRVLKPGGKFAFLEHVAFPKDNLAYWIQTAMAPFWKVYLNDCCLTRNITTNQFSQTHFSDLSFQVIYPSRLPLFFRPHVLGIATK